MKRTDRTRRVLLILLGIIVILIMLMMEEPGMAAGRKDTSLLKNPLSNFEYRISK